MGFFDRFTKPKGVAAAIAPEKERALRALLDAGSTLHGKGDIDGALAVFRRLIADADAVGHRGLSAAGHQRAGVMLDLKGDKAGAEAEVRAALAVDLELEGADGPTVRQDHFTLGIVLAAVDPLRAEASLLESARVAGVIGDDDARGRAALAVAQLRLQRGARAEALELLWGMRPGGLHRRTPSDHKGGPLLVELLGERGRCDDIVALLPGCCSAVAYWHAKLEQRRVDDATFTTILQGAVDTCVAAYHVFLRADRVDDALATLEHLSFLLGPSAANDIAALRARATGPAS